MIIQNMKPCPAYSPAMKSSHTSNTLIMRFTFVTGLSAV